MEYLLERAKQELNVYFEKKHENVIQLEGRPNVIHTFRLKGKDLSTPNNYFRILCRKTKVYEKN